MLHFANFISSIRGIDIDIHRLDIKGTMSRIFYINYSHCTLDKLCNMSK